MNTSKPSHYSANTPVKLTDLYSVPAFKDNHPYLFKSGGELDYLLRNRNTNGLSKCGAVIASPSGRKLTIIAPRFVEWIMNGGDSNDVEA